MASDKDSFEQSKIVITALKALLIIFIFLFSIDLMGNAFKLLGENAAQSLIYATTNPFIGLFIGLLVTAIIQSSSTSTSMIVAMVASGSITMSDAVPMIMGANVGTTLTSTIVSLGFITRKNEFRKALAASTVHDFFNILTVLILFPLEYYYGLVSSISQQITGFFLDQGKSDNSSNFGFKLFDVIPITKYIIAFIDNSLLSIVFSFAMLFGSIKLLSRLIYKLMIGESQGKLSKFIFDKSLKSFSWGAVITAGVQSSSVTTSLVVPFVATGKVSLKNATPFIMGANIGTTITAFIAVLFESSTAMSIAVTHLLFNLVGVAVFLPSQYLRNIPIRLAHGFGALTISYRLAGVAYIIFTFFIIPFTLIYFNRNAAEIKEITYQVAFEGEISEKKVISVTAKNKRYGSVLGVSPHPLTYNAKDDVLNIYRSNDVLFINDRFYLIKQEGFCWDDQEAQGKYSMCIENILPEWKRNGLSFDSVYVFKQSFYTPDKDTTHYLYHISIEDKVLIKKEQFTKAGKLILSEEVSNIETK